MDFISWPHSFLTGYISPFWQIILLWIILCLCLRLGKLGTAFRVFNTLYHELGHAIMSLITSGSVQRIELFSNAGGAAHTASKSGFARFMVSIAGYPFATAVGWLALTQAQRIPVLYVAYGILATYVLALLLWVRNQYGILWLIVNIALLGAAIYFKTGTGLRWYLFIMGSFVLIESIWTAFVLLYISAENPREAGDAKSLRDLTYIPAIVWALVFAAVTFYFVNLTFAHVLGHALWKG